MNNKDFINHIHSLLKGNEKYLDNEGDLLVDEVRRLANKYDESLLTLLYSDDKARDTFFVKVGDTTVFKQSDFDFFLEEKLIDNSYTAYENRIGLASGNRMLKDVNDVVLNFPYKDCVLEGGQSTEEGLDTYFECSDKTKEYEEKTAKRKEIFFNQVLAKDEIDRLTEPKAFENIKRYTKDGEEEVQKFKRNDEGTITDNLIIKGNNLLALHSLLPEFEGKVKLIYIDPPYNTGSDGFAYNDNFNHSSWLVFMKNRLEQAKKLLADDGFIAVQCDDNEQAYLKVILDQIFLRENYRNTIYWHRTFAGKTVSKNLPWNTDIIHLYSKSVITNINNVTTELTEKDIKAYNKDDKDGRGKYSTVSLQKTGGPGPLTTYDYIDNQGDTWKCPIKGWRMRKEKLKALEDDNRLYITDKTIREKYYLNERMDIGKQIDNFWGDLGNLNRVNDDKYDIAGQKPEKLIQRIIELTTNEQSIIIDYHLGSGTTAGVAHKMGRQYIGIEQMDYIESFVIERLNNVIQGDQTGISKAVDWKGGGSFVYMELAKNNQKAIEHIENCQSYDELVVFFDEMCATYFLDYNLKIKEFRETVSKEENFKALSLDQQRKMFAKMLDLNQLYVNVSDMEDAKFKLSDKDIQATKDFYKK